MKLQALSLIGATAFFAKCNVCASYSSIVPSPVKSRNRFGSSSKTVGNQYIEQRSTKIKSSTKLSKSSVASQGWHRRIWAKVVPVRKTDTSSSMYVSDATVVETDSGIARRYLEAQDNYMTRNFEMENTDIYALQSQQSLLAFPIPMDSRDESLPTIEKGSPFTRITRNTFQKILTERLHKWSNGINTNMIVECDPTSNLLQFLRGQFYCDATIHLDRIVFGNIQFSGGQLQARNFCLNLFSFAPINIPMAPSPRYPNQFDLVAQNMTFTQTDLWESSCIRNGLRRLITRILRNRGLTTTVINIESIQILSSGKLSCIGQASILFGPPIQFEVRSGIDIAGRGHIVTFPGLEIAVNPAMGLFVPVIPDITVDLGHNAKLLDVCIDGNNGTVKISASVTITPEHTIQIKEYIQSTQSYGALCFVDVGQWLTRIGRFAH